MDKTLYVYDASEGTDRFIGCLDSSFIHGKEVFSFSYDPSWLESGRKDLFPEPYLFPFSGRQYAKSGTLFGIFTDSCPDRWGRTLLQRQEALLSQKEKRLPRALNESDYLLGVNDALRMGSLRYKRSLTGPFLSNPSNESIPPLERLALLEDAAFALEEGKENAKELHELLSPGSSLGGARPKANVQTENGELWIAKFPRKDDDYDQSLWEMVAYELAQRLGIEFAPSLLRKDSRYGSTFLTKRFDRDGQKRIPFVSMLALLGKKDGESSSYLEVAEFLRTFSSDSRRDLRELWMRILFNIAIGNTDNHLRNLGMIHGEKGWRLSPDYDANPNPNSRHFALPLFSEDDSLSFSLSQRLAPYLGIKKEQAKADIDLVNTLVTSSWKKIAENVGSKAEEISLLAPAFQEKK
jgi:serine/threonine-protein kinase HipA